MAGYSGGIDLCYVTGFIDIILATILVWRGQTAFTVFNSEKATTNKTENAVLYARLLYQSGHFMPATIALKIK